MGVKEKGEDKPPEFCSPKHETAQRRNGCKVVVYHSESGIKIFKEKRK
jgi:hypothetical protein